MHIYYMHIQNSLLVTCEYPAKIFMGTDTLTVLLTVQTITMWL